MMVDKWTHSHEQESRDAAFKKLEEMHSSSDSAWRHLEAGVDAAWASMKSALEKASAQLKK